MTILKGRGHKNGRAFALPTEADLVVFLMLLKLYRGYTGGLAARIENSTAPPVRSILRG